MAKNYVVLRNGEPQADETLDRVLVDVEKIQMDLENVLGAESVEKENAKGEKFTRLQPKQSFTHVDPIQKKRLTELSRWIMSAFSADKSEAGVGRQPKVDLDDLQVLFGKMRSDMPNTKPSIFCKWVSSTYNKRYANPNDPTTEIEASYVKKWAKEKGWFDLPVQPSTE